MGGSLDFAQVIALVRALQALHIFAIKLYVVILIAATFGAALE